MRVRHVLRIACISALVASPALAQNADDPYLWLEDVTGEKPLAWVAKQNARSVADYTQSESFRKLNDRLLAIFDSRDRIPYVSKIGGQYYNFWRDAQHPRGVWRRTSLAEFKKASPAWEVVIDLDSLGTAEKESWVWHGANCLRPAYVRCLVSLSRGGADADVTREFDLPTKSFVTNGFYLPEAKGGAGWIDQNTVYVSTDFGPGSMTTSGYPRIVKVWKRGTPLDSAQQIFEGQSTDVSVGGYRDHTKGFERDFVYRGITFYSSDVFQRKDGKLVKIEVPADANMNTHREWLLVELRTDWTTGGKTYPAGSLIATNFDAFMNGKRDFDVLFQPTDRKSLAGYSTTRNYILVNELDNVRNRIYVLSHDKNGWKRAPLAGMPEFGTVSANAVDSDESDDFFMTVTDYVTPTSLSMGTVGKGTPTKLKSLPAFFDAKNLEVSQHEATSKDGTRIPYFQVSRKGMALDGKNPTLLYGYGGFEISMLPGYSAGVGAAWLEKGGTYVVANIRGGGEFGPKWHQSALKANRHKAYEDFIAVAEDLIARKVTSTPHLGIMGGSNGGLLMGNMLTMRPDLFGAIVAQVPLLDMKRYNHLLAGASWMGEYGDPDDPKEWEFIRTFSPYQNMNATTKYPPTLFTTSTRDDRVHPGHARKMVAKMIDQGHDVVYYENVEGGHGGSANNKQAAFMTALAYTFLWDKLSPRPVTP